MCNSEVLAQNDSINFKKNTAIKNYILLDEKEFNLLVDNKVIMKELSLSMKDSIKPEKISRRLRLFLNKTYNEKQLLMTLKMDRHLKGTSGTFELDTTLKDNEAMKFKSLEEFLAYKKKMDSIMFGNMKIKDTIIKKKNKP